MPQMFKHLSVLQMAALFCLGSVTVTWLGVLLFNRVAHGWIHGRRNANEMIGLTLASFSTLYGILLGLLAVEAYQDFSAVGDVVSKEALSIAALHKDFDGFPSPTRGELQDKLRAYAQEAVDAVHPPPDVAQNPHSASPGLDALFEQVMNFQPKLKSQEIVQAETFTRLNALVEHRRYLIAAGENGIPKELWWVVCLGGFLLIGLMCIFDMEFHVHLILSSAMALFLGSVVFLIAAMDNPFNGGMTVDFRADRSRAADFPDGAMRRSRRGRSEPSAPRVRVKDRARQKIWTSVDPEDRGHAHRSVSSAAGSRPVADAPRGFHRAIGPVAITQMVRHGARFCL